MTVLRGLEKYQRGKIKIKNSTIFTFYLLDSTVEPKLYIPIYLQRHVPERTIDLRSNYISVVGSFDVIVEDNLNYLKDGFGSGDVDGNDSMIALNAIKDDTVCSHKIHRYPWSQRGCNLQYKEKNAQEANNSVYQMFERIWRCMLPISVWSRMNRV